MQSYFDLYEYRLLIAEAYRKRNNALLANEDASTVLEHFRQERDTVFATHPQSALDEAQKRVFKGLHYFPFNPDMCFTVTVDTDVEANRQEVVMSATESMMMTTVGRVHFVVAQQPATLSLYWLDIYGGGLFLPFRDATCPQESYGGGRYLFDTIKGSNFLSSMDEPMPGHPQGDAPPIDDGVDARRMGGASPCGCPGDGIRDSALMPAPQKSEPRLKPGQTQIVLDFNYAYNPSCAYNDAWTCPLAPIENRLNLSIPAGEKKYK